MPSGPYSSMPGSQPGKTRVDGKEFFRLVRNRLSYEQFGAFLANVKELNSQKQTKEIRVEAKGITAKPSSNHMGQL
ncbi:UNVERIFIED_CONTAM: hypothetical protein Sangu_1101200 [Sesamum angustifolium]|uniref:At4g15545-like C-terminal domain-containing protein n=1 Tax=Sesamum angustifolium TaxID=2727405 RepID=A0AAW2NYT4_9LAMI